MVADQRIEQRGTLEVQILDEGEKVLEGDSELASDLARGLEPLTTWLHVFNRDAYRNSR